jgi:hypothetical protein
MRARVPAGVQSRSAARRARALQAYASAEEAESDSALLVPRREVRASPSVTPVSAGQGRPCSSPPVSVRGSRGVEGTSGVGGGEASRRDLGWWCGFRRSRCACY